MDRKRRVSGFTMAEMLIVVAIIMVLGGVVFVAVTSHQRSMAQLERDTIAKEIFFAAQNHLTMVESQGFLPDENGTVDFGNNEAAVTSSTERVYNNVYSFSVSGGSSFTGNSVLDLMLPFGSIDETVRAGGSYIIRYQAKPALVLDVFYCPKATSSSGQLNYTHDLGTETYTSVASYAGFGTNRKNCLTDNCVLGWYGAEGEKGIEDSGEYVIETPTIEVINKERLIVNITDPNKGKTVSSDDTSPLALLCLIITGEKENVGTEASRAQIAIILEGDSDRVKWIPAAEGVEPHYEVILDDITTPKGANGDGLHFADLNDITDDDTITIKKDESGNPIKFKPGENITVQAVAYSNSKLTNIAYSVEKTTNSLFADSQPVTGGTGKTAMIGNFRHLENLDVTVSGLDTTLGFAKAEQIVDLKEPTLVEDDVESGTSTVTEEDLSWTGFVSAIKAAKDSDTVKVYAKGDATGIEDGCFRPVDLSYVLDYDGKYHKIEGVETKYNADAGLFGSIISNGSKISNLELVDFNIATSSGNAGALAGTLSGTTVTNVLAINSTDTTDVNVSSASGAVGGLIGSATDCTIQKSAAALIVSATDGYAGGLIGTTTGGTVSGCYSGGHTIDDPKGTGGVVYKHDSGEYNVTATVTGSTGGIAGGLIGNAGATEISYSYSTCSVQGVKAGGFIGTGSGNIISSYCTGLVMSTAATPVEGAFAAECTGTTTDCHYFEIVNEFEDEDLGYNYRTAIPVTETGDGSKDGVTALDEDASGYNTFTSAWSDAVPYLETTLKNYYGEGTGDARVPKYNLKSVKELGAEITENSGAEGDTTPADFVATHYGDWPAPEIFVVNTQTN